MEKQRVRSTGRLTWRLARLHTMEFHDGAACHDTSTEPSFQDLWSSILIRNKLESGIKVSEMQWTKLAPRFLPVNQTAVQQLCAAVGEDVCQETHRPFVFAFFDGVCDRA